MATLGDVERYMDEHEDVCDVGTPASEELINKAERFLQVTFPQDYRDFLSRWGTLGIGPLEYYGIIGDDFESSSAPDAIWYTNRKRQTAGLPHELIVLNDSGDSLYCLDTSDPTRSPVVVWDIVSRQVAEIRAEGLFDYILAEANEFGED